MNKILNKDQNTPKGRELQTYVTKLKPHDKHTNTHTHTHTQEVDNTFCCDCSKWTEGAADRKSDLFVCILPRVRKAKVQNSTNFLLYRGSLVQNKIYRNDVSVCSQTVFVTNGLTDPSAKRWWSCVAANKERMKPCSRIGWVRRCVN